MDVVNPACIVVNVVNSVGVFLINSDSLSCSRNILNTDVLIVQYNIKCFSTYQSKSVYVKTLNIGYSPRFSKKGDEFHSSVLD